MLALVGFVGLCLLVGAAGGTVVAGTTWGWFLSLTYPSGLMPHWLFVPVWAGLYALIGVAGWLAWRRAISTRSLRLWGWQLAANAFWAPAFFALHSPPLALAISVVLLVLIALTMRAFARIAAVGCLASGALPGLDRLHDLSDGWLLVAEPDLS